MYKPGREIMANLSLVNVDVGYNFTKNVPNNSNSTSSTGTMQNDNLSSHSTQSVRPVATISPSTTATTVAPSVTYDMHVTGMGYVMMALVFLMGAIIVWVTAWQIIRRRRQIVVAGGYFPPGRTTKQRIQCRYETIEHWIITKTVQPHDDFCATVSSNFGHHQTHEKQKRQRQRQHCCNTPVTTDAESSALSAECALSCTGIEAAVGKEADETDILAMTPPQSPSIVRSPSSNEVSSTEHNVTDGHEEEERTLENYDKEKDPDNDVRECPICMAELQVGQVVSWSANPACRHAYHHQCIKEWLLRHTLCCLCKNIYLPVDEKRGKAKTAALHELSQRFAAAAATSYYCIESGLVRIPKTVLCTRQELAQLESRIFDGTVPPSKLVELRGSLQESSSSSVNGGNIIAAINTRHDPCHIIETDDPTASNSLDMNFSFDSGVDDLDGAALSSFSVDLEMGMSGAAHSGSRHEEEQPYSEKGICWLMNQELISAADYLEQNKSVFPDNRCRIQTDDEGGVEVQETTSQRPVEDLDAV